MLLKLVVIALIPLAFSGGMLYERHHPTPLTQSQLEVGVPYWVGSILPHPTEKKRYIAWVTKTAYDPFKTVELDHLIVLGEYFEMDRMGRVIPLRKDADGSFKPMIILPEPPPKENKAL